MSDKGTPFVGIEFARGRVTERELKALEAVDATGTQLGAARMLGISLPVLHRRLASAEAKVEEPLVIATNRGTRLTGAGSRLLHHYEEQVRRLSDGIAPAVACTPVSELRVHRAISRMEGKGRGIAVIVATDETNIALFTSGQVDLLVLDDPRFAFETLRDYRVQEVGGDVLLWFDRGEEYARFRYGPQRLGFEHLESEGIPHRIVRHIADVQTLVDSGLSFFLSESLTLRWGIASRGKGTRSLVPYTILGVLGEQPAVEVTTLLRELGSSR